MSRIVFLNGEYLPPEAARISIFDRAVNFGDAIYEVAGVLDGKLVDFEHHMQRYAGSLQKMQMKSPLDREQILAAFRRLVELNQVDEGLVYMQVTRGVAERPRPRPAFDSPAYRTFVGRGATSRPSTCSARCWPSMPRTRPVPTRR